MEGAGEVSCHCNPCTGLNSDRDSEAELTQSATWVWWTGQSNGSNVQLQKT